MKPNGQNVLAPGARVIIRDAEWLIRKMDRTSTGGQAITAVGLSECVKDKEAVFLTEIDTDIQTLDPVDTKFVKDASSHYSDSLLYMESLLRQTPPTDENLYIGYQGIIDSVPYQLDPAILALKQPRQRILMADAVGLGKTIEAGILLSELIKRGKGKRILVLTVKSMLTQFQKELWSRFTIPLVRLDSIGIQRIRTKIPTNHNPFYYYDKSIISIDTLKQDAEYRTYIENSYWDIIVIDEAHNVAERGSGSGTHSMRARLVKLLSSRSDTLIMLTATPHDGKPRAFASLMTMLNPTAIANPEDYGPNDVKGLFIRRFKKDIKDQVAKSFMERKIAVAECIASPVEEKVFDKFVQLNFTKLEQRRTAGMLFKTTLEKSLFSSPQACLQTVNNRMERLKKDNNQVYDDDIRKLEQLASSLAEISKKDFSKYRKLLEIIQDSKHGLGWDGKDTTDRLVIFTERIETLNFLEKNLKSDLNLKDDQIAILHGTMSDLEQQEIVDSFGRDESPIRLLIASDVASEGINLHFLCHKMIHFDIPWSLMVFQQRNGRIDRYGQEREPLIVYLKTESQNPKIKGDVRILELLIQKDEQAVKNIGDPSALMGVYDITEEELITAKGIEDSMNTDDFEELLKKVPVDPLSLLMGDEGTPKGEHIESVKQKMPSFFPDDFSYLRAAVEYIKKNQTLQSAFYENDRTVTITANDEMKGRFKYLPQEIWPEDSEFILSDDRTLLMREIKKSRQKEKEWPKLHLLWEQHPIFIWVNDKVVAAFGRQEAPVINIKGSLSDKEVIFIMTGLIPNRKSHPLIHRWFGVSFLDNKFNAILDFADVLKKSGIDKTKYPNTDRPVEDDRLRKLLAIAVEKAYKWMSQRRQEFVNGMKGKLDAYTEELERLRLKKYSQLEFDFKDATGQSVLNRKEKEKREIDRIFKEYREWIQDTMQTEDKPYIRVVAVLRGEA
jgi:superfamily II DNA/RNA helicase